MNNKKDLKKFEDGFKLVFYFMVVLGLASSFFSIVSLWIKPNIVGYENISLPLGLKIELTLWAFLGWFIAVIYVCQKIHELLIKNFEV